MAVAISSRHYLSVGKTLMNVFQWGLVVPCETLRRFRGFADMHFSRYADSKLRAGRI
jgi:hypothetical protein